MKDNDKMSNNVQVGFSFYPFLLNSQLFIMIVTYVVLP